MNETTPQKLRSYASYKGSGTPWLGLVPDHWQLRRLKNLARIKTGGRDTIHKRDDGKYPFFIRSQTVEKIDTWAHDGEAVLTAGDGAVGQIFHYVNGKFDYHQRVYMFYDFTDIVGKFFFHYFKSTLHHETSQGTAKSTVDSLRLPMLQNLPVVVPPIDEQAAIVRYLDHADELINRYISAKERLIVLLEEQRQAVIHQAVTRGLDPNVRLKPSAVEWLGDVPAHWEVRRLKAVLQPIDRRSVTGSETLLSLRRDHGVVAYDEHFTRPSQSRSLVGYKLVTTGQLVLNRLQANNGLIFNSNLDGLVSPDYSVFENKSPLRMQFVSDLLRTIPYRTHFRQRSTGLGTGTAGFLRLYDDKFLETKVHLPPVQEQVAIIEHINQADANINAAISHARRQVDLLREYRTRLIADAVTGQIDVRDAAIDLPN